MIEQLKEKYHILINDHVRLYWMNLDHRPISMEKCTPRVLFLPDGEMIAEASWVQMILSLFHYLQDHNPKSEEDLFAFRVDWSKDLIMFDPNERASNFHQTKYGYYINLNMTSLHYSWFLIELIKFYNLNPNDFKLIYNRMPVAEPVEVRNYFISAIKNEFIDYLVDVEQYDEIKAKKIANNIDKLNGFLETLPTGYNNLFLFDSLQYYENYQYILLERFKLSKYGSNPKSVYLAEKYLKLLDAYYKFAGYKRFNKQKNAFTEKSKYYVIYDYLINCKEDILILSFKEFENMVGVEIPPKAYKEKWIWQSEKHAMGPYFHKAKYFPILDFEKQCVCIVKQK